LYSSTAPYPLSRIAMNGAAKCRKSLARPLHDLPDGRGRGVATDVSRYPVADRPAAGTARAKHEARRASGVASDEGRGMPRYGQSSAVPRSGSVNRPLRHPFACGEGDLSFPKPVEDPILARNRRESGECRFTTGRRVSVERFPSSTPRPPRSTGIAVLPGRRGEPRSAAQRLWRR